MAIVRLRKDVTLLRAGGVMAIVRVHEDVTLVGKSGQNWYNEGS